MDHTGEALADLALEPALHQTAHAPSPWTTSVGSWTDDSTAGPTRERSTLASMRPVSIYSLALLFLIGSARLAISAEFPLSSHEPVRLCIAASIFCVLLAGAVVAAGQRFTQQVEQVGILIGLGLLGTFVATAQTAAGMVLSTFGFQWAAVYLAYYLPRRLTVLYLVAMSLSLNVAFAVSSVRWQPAAWVFITGSILGVSIVVSSVVHRLRTQARTDQLTGLLNRSGFIEQATPLIARCHRLGIPAALCAIDLDDFKGVNDAVGHLGADRLLVELADAWSETLRNGAVISRHGGDEFLLLLPATTDTEATDVIERLRLLTRLRWSAGVTEVRAGEPIDDAYERADRELYRTKTTRAKADASLDEATS